MISHANHMLILKNVIERFLQTYFINKCFFPLAVDSLIPSLFYSQHVCDMYGYKTFSVKIPQRKCKMCVEV